MEDEKRMLTINEMAEVLQVSARTIRRLTQAGMIPCARVGRRRPRYDREAVIKALQAQEGL